MEAARQASRIERSELGLDLSQCAACDKNAERLRLLLAFNGQSRRFVNDREQIMATSQSHGPLSISGLGWSLSVTFVVLFVLCMLAAFFVPLRLAHGWVGLLSDAPIDSSRIWIDGFVWSLVLGWLIALIFGTIYNWIVAHRALQEIR